MSNLINKRISEYNKTHQDAIDELNRYLNHTQSDMQLISRFLIEQSDINPYSFLPEQWASETATATGMISLLNVIHHALYDDGDITFISVNDKPKITFKHQSEVTLDNTLTPDEMHMLSRGFKYEITVIPTVSEFVQRITEYHKSDILRCFIQDAALHSVEFAVQCYSQYAVYNDWGNDKDILSKIEEMGTRFSRFRV